MAFPRRFCRDEMARLWNAGVPTAEISRRLKAWPSSICKAAQAMGLPPRPCGRRNGFQEAAETRARKAEASRGHWEALRAQAPADLTPDQVTDFVTLRRARYSVEEAVAIVRRPRARLRATPPEARHG